MMLFGILPQEFHSGKIALLIIDHAGKLRHRFIVGPGIDGVGRQQIIAGFQFHQQSQHIYAFSALRAEQCVRLDRGFKGYERNASVFIGSPLQMARNSIVPLRSFRIIGMRKPTPACRKDVSGKLRQGAPREEIQKFYTKNGRNSWRLKNLTRVATVCSICYDTFVLSIVKHLCMVETRVNSKTERNISHGC